MSERMTNSNWNSRTAGRIQTENISKVELEQTKYALFCRNIQSQCTHARSPRNILALEMIEKFWMGSNKCNVFFEWETKNRDWSASRKCSGFSERRTQSNQLNHSCVFTDWDVYKMRFRINCVIAKHGKYTQSSHASHAHNSNGQKKEKCLHTPCVCPHSIPNILTHAANLFNLF